MNFRHAIIIFSVFLLLFAAGCGKNSAYDTSAQDNGISDEKVSKSILSQFDEETQELITRNNDYVAPKPTPFEKIDDALEEGEITKAESVMLTILAAYDDKNLPDSYRGEMPEVMGDGVLNDAEWWLHENWDSLTEEQQELMEPFYVLPDDPKSFFNQDEQEKSDTLKTLEIIPSVNAADDWMEKEVVMETGPERKILIIYKESTPNIETKIKWVNESINKAWPMFKNLYGLTPTDDTYIFITDVPNNFLGTAIRMPARGANRCVVRVSKAITDEKISKPVTSHELFHCFQYYIPLKYDKIPRKWLMEVTATWSEHWVWPDYNSEWRFLGQFFPLLSEDLIQWDRTKEYPRYTWYYYLMQETGDLGRVIADLKAVKTKDGRVVTSEIPGFTNHFANYALWNWNQDPEFRYSDTLSFPTGTYKGRKMSPNGPPYTSKVISTKTITDQKWSPDTLSMSYRSYSFTDSIDRAAFEFEKDGTDRQQRQALIKIGDVWHWEDWTNIRERKFCRTRPEEKVDTVVLILSNAEHDMSKLYDLKYKVNTTGKCNPEWRGSTTWSWSNSWGWQILYATHTLGWTASMTSDDTLVYDEEEDQFLVKNQVISYSENWYHNVEFDQDCGMIYERQNKQYSGTAQSSWEIPKEHPSLGDAPVRMYVDDDDPLLYEVKLNVLPNRKNWITLADHTASRKIACPLEGIMTPSSGSYIKSDTRYLELTDFNSKPYSIKLQISEDGKRIKGSKTQKLGSGEEEWDIRITVDYAYG